MTRPRSPVREIRQRRDWRAADLAALAGISIGAVTMVERGELAKLPARLESALIRLGEDVEQVRARQAEFVEARRRELEMQALQPSDSEQ